MLRSLTILTMLLAFVLSTTAVAGSSRYLAAPAVKWENNRLTGQVKNVPIKSLLTELLQKQGYQWEVRGNISGKIGVNFDNVTIEESVRKIMRLGRYNYSLIQANPESSDGSNAPKIKELKIFQNDQIIRFSRTSQKISASSNKAHIRTGRKTPSRTSQRISTPLKKADAKTVSKPRKAKTAATVPARRPITKTKAPPPPPAKPTNEELAEMDRQLKEMADEMLAEKEITPEQYAEMMKEMEEFAEMLKEDGLQNN